MKYKFNIEIPEKPKLPNTMGWGKLNKFYERKRWNKIIAKWCIGQTPKDPITKARVHITRLSSSQPDRDNNFASLKGLLDSLITNGFLSDDNEDVINLQCDWEKAPKGKGGVRIRIEEL